MVVLIGDHGIKFSLDDRMNGGREQGRKVEGVPKGWTPTAWAENCRRMAAVCRETNPNAADEWDAKADRIEAALAERAASC